MGSGCDPLEKGKQGHPCRYWLGYRRGVQEGGTLAPSTTAPAEKRSGTTEDTFSLTGVQPLLPVPVIFSPSHPAPHGLPMIGASSVFLSSVSPYTPGVSILDSPELRRYFPT